MPPNLELTKESSPDLADFLDLRLCRLDRLPVDAYISSISTSPSVNPN